jgi:hypothetical protein
MVVSETDRGQSVGCQLNNAKTEHSENYRHSVKEGCHSGTADNCGTYSVDGNSTDWLVPAKACTERTVSGHASREQQGSLSF